MVVNIESSHFSHDRSVSNARLFARIARAGALNAMASA